MYQTFYHLNVTVPCECCEAIVIPFVLVPVTQLDYIFEYLPILDPFCVLLLLATDVIFFQKLGYYSENTKSKIKVIYTDQSSDH